MDWSPAAEIGLVVEPVAVADAEMNAAVEDYTVGVVAVPAAAVEDAVVVEAALVGIGVAFD